MSASAVIFYVIAAVILGAGILAVTTRKIFRSAIYLLFSLIGIAGFYFWLAVEFIAAVQIVVYVGGIVVLIIFSVFLTQQAGNQMPRPVRGRTIFSAVAVICGFAFSCMLISRYPFPGHAGTTLQSTVSNIGYQMLSTNGNGYVLPFEVVSILLLSAMIGCIVIAIKSKSIADE